MQENVPSTLVYVHCNGVVIQPQLKKNKTGFKTADGTKVHRLDAQFLKNTHSRTQIMCDLVMNQNIAYKMD